MEIATEVFRYQLNSSSINHQKTNEVIIIVNAFSTFFLDLTIKKEKDINQIPQLITSLLVQDIVCV